MTIKYWTNFSKRTNSTKQPTGGTEITVRLKEPCGISSPTFICSGVPDTVKYVQAFGRYYFVSEVTHNGGLIEISCTSDPLATYKSAIGALYADVEYTSASNDITMTDPRNYPTNQILKVSTNLGTLPTFNTGASCYIIGVTDNSGASYYMMNEAKFAQFTQILFDKSLNGELTRDFFDMNNILISACVMPRYALIGTDTIVLGNPAGAHIDLLSGVYRIQPEDRMITLYEDTKDVVYPSDSMGTYGINYLDAAPYTTGILFLPFVGCVELDTGAMTSQKSIYIKATLDQINGDVVYKIGLDGSNIIATYSGNCAASVPVTGTSYNPIGAAAGVLGVIGGVAAFAAGVASKGATTALAGLGGAAASGAGVFNSLSHKTQINGSLSSFVSASLGLSITATVLTKKPAETALRSYQSISGMPYFKPSTISNLSGYVKCNGASISIDGFDSDREAINGYLNSGFYYE